ncbi:MAG: CcmD family protein [Ignavibacteriae bacterium]|nr:CcmD family protein [Ignavibacteriota bacterium]MCB0723978.1 CcmD family protein [Ignavibacteriota bacterium]MCB9243978.1 CcmD family protein [Ignavibacteriales bacterium]
MFDSLYDFLSINDVYIVLVIVLIIWFGIFYQLNRIDAKIKKLEREN